MDLQRLIHNVERLLPFAENVVNLADDAEIDSFAAAISYDSKKGQRLIEIFKGLLHLSQSTVSLSDALKGRGLASAIAAGAIKLKRGGRKINRFLKFVLSEVD